MNSAKTYHLKVNHARGTFSQDIVCFTADSYADAVQVAHDKWQQTGRTVQLCSGKDGMYWWHYIALDGEATDRNTNSGVCGHQFLSRKVAA
jgi:hypothetical protein